MKPLDIPKFSSFHNDYVLVTSFDLSRSDIYVRSYIYGIDEVGMFGEYGQPLYTRATSLQKSRKRASLFRIHLLPMYPSLKSNIGFQHYSKVHLAAIVYLSKIIAQLSTSNERFTKLIIVIKHSQAMICIICRSLRGLKRYYRTANHVLMFITSEYIINSYMHLIHLLPPRPVVM